MATRDNAENDTMSRFTRVVKEIEQTFGQLIEQLTVRKETLLKKVLQLREDFINKESSREEAIRELKKAQEHMKQLSLKANLTIPIHHQASQAYEQGVKQLATPTKLPYLSFSCPTRNRLVQLVEAFGVLSQGISYLAKKEPILTAGREGKGIGEFDLARGISLDEENKLIYIIDMCNSRVQIFSFQGEFISSFGENVLKKPWGISVTGLHIFITDISLHSLIRYDKKNIRQIDRIGSRGSERGKLDEPRGLAVDVNGDVYVADSDNNRVSVFSKKIKFISCIGQGILRSPSDIKLTTESVVVLDWNVKCVHFLIRNGEIIRSCVAQGWKQESLVYRPFFFCLDKDDNILISDCDNHNIKIVSTSGKLVHKIGSEGNKRGHFINPKGIAISDAGNIYMVSHNPEHVLQIY